MAQKITKEQVEKVAKLTKLKLSQEEIDFFARNFSDTLTQINVLNELDTSEVPETYQVTGLTNVFQDEGYSETLKKEDVLKNAKNVKEGMFVTDAVFDR